MKTSGVAVQKKAPHMRGIILIFIQTRDQAVTLVLPFTFAMTSSAILFGAGA
jgi:hypothetical protein